jgi:hypothetical protein
LSGGLGDELAVTLAPLLIILFSILFMSNEGDLRTSPCCLCIPPDFCWVASEMNLLFLCPPPYCLCVCVSSFIFAFCMLSVSYQRKIDG